MCSGAISDNDWGAGVDQPAHFFGGMLIDVVASIPIFPPIMNHFGGDPIWFGLIMPLNLAIAWSYPVVGSGLETGGSTPLPVALCLRMRRG